MRLLNISNIAKHNAETYSLYENSKKHTCGILKHIKNCKLINKVSIKHSCKIQIDSWFS